MVFDMDGVIIDSNPLHVQAWRVYNRRHGMDAGDTLADRMYGRRNDEIVRELFGSEMSTAEVAAHGAAKEALYRKLLAPELCARLVPGVCEFIARHAASAMGVATNAERANVDFILDGSGLRSYFRVVLDGEQVQRAKPDPEIYLRAAELLGVTPRNSIVFEDSYTGVEAARAAGARVVGLTTTHAHLPGAALEIADFRSAALEPWLRLQAPEA